MEVLVLLSWLDNDAVFPSGFIMALHWDRHFIWTMQFLKDWLPEPAVALQIQTLQINK